MRPFCAIASKCAAWLREKPEPLSGFSRDWNGRDGMADFVAVIPLCLSCWRTVLAARGVSFCVVLNIWHLMQTAAQFSSELSPPLDAAKIWSNSTPIANGALQRVSGFSP